MELFGINISFGKKTKINSESVKQPKADVNYNYLVNSYTKSFDGEKNKGEIGPIIDYRLNYSALRMRSWQSLLESEISNTVLKRFTVWIVDKGLRLQSEPETNILENEGIKINPESFNDITESRFNIFSKSKKSSYSGMQSLNDLAKECFKTAKVGGDCLVVLRYVDNMVKVQIIDGAHVRTPLTSVINDNIVDGVELDSTGNHIAYHVCTSYNKHERIEAISKTTGLRVAFLVYGDKYRIDNVRGIPKIAVSLETLKKVERYKEAAVGSAEERQKIAYAIVHNQFSTGENPMADRLAGMMDADGGENDAISRDEQGEILANKVSVSTNKQAWNMPIGSDLKQLESKNEMFFKEFYGTNADIICASIGIPPNVAFSIYNDSFSASRAATKDWEHTIDVERDEFKSQFYEHIYAYWLHIEILKGKIQAPGYLLAFYQKDWMITEAYLNCRFTGPMFPHIDPLKEVKAEREKLGPLAANIPLTTIEKSTETLFGGNSTSNIEQFKDELDYAESLGYVLKEKTQVEQTTETTEND